MIMSPRPDLVVKDDWIDMNQLMGIEPGEAAVARGTGHTSHQMLTAPKGAVFVCATRERRYSIDLARHLGRADLLIYGSDWLEGERWRGMRNGSIVIDHFLASQLKPY